LPTLLLSSRQTEDAQKLWRACIAEKWTVLRVHGWQVPDVSPADATVYGEPLFARHVAQTLKLRLTEPAVDWLPKLPNRWRAREVRLTTLAEARCETAMKFIKPADEKCFDARVYSSGAALPPPGALPDDLPVLVQEVVDWQSEFRCFVLDRTVVATSSYWRDGEITRSEEGWLSSDPNLEEATRFCERFVGERDVEVATAVVVDVGIIRDRGWAVLEANAAFSSGIYGCDPVQVLRVLRRVCSVATLN